MKRSLSLSLAMYCYPLFWKLFGFVLGVDESNAPSSASLVSVWSRGVLNCYLPNFCIEESAKFLVEEPWPPGCPALGIEEFILSIPDSNLRL